MSSREGFSSSLVADKDFFQNGIWHDALRIIVDVWPQLRGKGLFPTWSRVSDPLWLIGKDLTECESYQECGVQLADLLANTVRRINRGSHNDIPSNELKEGSLKEAPGFKFGMSGINVFLQMPQDSQKLNRH